MAEISGALRDEQYKIERLDDAHSRIASLDSKLSNIEGQLLHTATKADVERAKIWMLVSVFGAAVSIGTLLVSANGS